MKKKAEILKEIQRIKTDPRFNYPPALVDVNAPLALIQVYQKARVEALEWALLSGGPERRCWSC